MSIENQPKAVFPPSPPMTDKGESDTSSLSDEEYCGSIPLLPESINPTEILAVDAASPDKHVPRDPRLIRLTGNHPFNCEAPLTELFNAGMGSLICEISEWLSCRISDAAGVALCAESWGCTPSS